MKSPITLVAPFERLVAEVRTFGKRHLRGASSSRRRAWNESPRVYRRHSVLSSPAIFPGRPCQVTRLRPSSCAARSGISKRGRASEPLREVSSRRGQNENDIADGSCDFDAVRGHGAATRHQHDPGDGHWHDPNCACQSPLCPRHTPQGLKIAGMQQWNTSTDFEKTRV